MVYAYRNCLGLLSHRRSCFRANVSSKRPIGNGARRKHFLRDWRLVSCDRHSWFCDVFICTCHGTLRARIEIFARAGLLAVFPARQVRIRDEYDRRFAQATQIDLIGYGLASFREDYLDQFVVWSHRAKVRILYPDPDFPTKNNSLADQRDKEEGHPVGKTRRDVFALEKEIGKLRDLKRDNFVLRRMRAIPSINMLRIDDEIFWGPYLVKQFSRNTPTLLVQRGGFLFEHLSQHFEALWTNDFSDESPENGHE